MFSLLCCDFRFVYAEGLVFAKAQNRSRTVLEFDVQRALLDWEISLSWLSHCKRHAKREMTKSSGELRDVTPKIGRRHDSIRVLCANGKSFLSLIKCNLSWEPRPVVGWRQRKVRIVSRCLAFLRCSISDSLRRLRASSSRRHLTRCVIWMCSHRSMLTMAMALFS